MLGEVCEIIMGQAPSGESYNENGEGYPLIAGAGDFKNGVITPKKYTTAPTKLSKKDDIVMSIRASIGDKVWCEENFCLGRGVSALRPKKDLDKKYLWHALSVVERDLIRKGRGATFLQVSKDDIKDLIISVPPLAEQQRIASILDKAEIVKRKRELAVIKMGMLNKEIFINMFSDLLEKPNTTLGSAFDVRDGTHDSPKGQTEGYPLITSKNLNNNTINLEDVSFINLEDFEAINRRSKVDYCDILMPMIGTIGNPVIVHDKNPQFAIKNVALIKTRNMEASFYVKGLLETHYFERYVLKESKGGTQKFLSLGNIRNFPIYVPSDEQLQKFSKISNALIQSQSFLVKSQRKLDEFLSSLQFAYMTRN